MSFRFASISTALIAILALGLTAAQVATESSSNEQHIRHIEEALLPAVVVKGESPSTSKLADSMTALHVPGVSIAVIHAGNIEWARGFGVTKLGGPPVTASTVFQAGSISKPVMAIAVLRLVESGKLNLDADVKPVPENVEGARERIHGKEKGHSPRAA